MALWLSVLGWIGFSCIALAALAFVLTSARERRWRAVKIAVSLFGPFLAAYIMLLVVDFPGRSFLVMATITIEALVILLLTLPIGTSDHLRIVEQQDRVDERDIVFHRFHRLQPGMAEYDDYYRQASREEGA